MKLKRILSLALSGVLAVSMLTACGGFGGGSGNRVVNVSAAFRTTLNNQLDDLEQATVNRPVTLTISGRFEGVEFSGIEVVVDVVAAE